MSSGTFLPHVPAAVGAETPEAMLERAIEQTRRSPIVTAASIAVAANGAVLALVALQLGFAVWLARPYQYVPHAMLVTALAFVALGSRIYSQRVWAVVAALVLLAISAIALCVWFVFTVLSGMFSLLVIAAPLACIAAGVFVWLALGPCIRTRAIRQQAFRAGMDIDL